MTKALTTQEAMIVIIRNKAREIRAELYKRCGTNMPTKPEEWLIYGRYEGLCWALNEIKKKR